MNNLAASPAIGGRGETNEMCLVLPVCGKQTRSWWLGSQGNVCYQKCTHNLQALREGSYVFPRADICSAWIWEITLQNILMFS